MGGRGAGWPLSTPEEPHVGIALRWRPVPRRFTHRSRPPAPLRCPSDATFALRRSDGRGLFIRTNVPDFVVWFHSLANSQPGGQVRVGAASAAGARLDRGVTSMGQTGPENLSAFVDTTLVSTRSAGECPDHGAGGASEIGSEPIGPMRPRVAGRLPMRSTGVGSVVGYNKRAESREPRAESREPRAELCPR